MSRCKLIIFSDIHYLDERPEKLDFNLSENKNLYSDFGNNVTTLFIDSSATAEQKVDLPDPESPAIP